MSVHFEEHRHHPHEYESHTILGRYRTPGLSRWLISRHIVRTHSQAYHTLVATIMVCLFLTGFIIWFANFSNPKAIYDPATGHPARVQTAQIPPP